MSRFVLSILIAVALLACQIQAAAPAKLASKPAASPKTPAALPPLEKASWIWRQADDETCELRTVVRLPDKPTAASILITADNGYELWINGAEVGSDIGHGAEHWNTVERYDIASRLAMGVNVIAVRGTDMGGVRGVIAAARIECAGQPPVELVSDAAWHAAAGAKLLDYSHPEYVEGPEWSKALVVGPMGSKPWGHLAYNPAARRPPAAVPTPIAAPDKDFRWPAGIVFVGDDCSVYTPIRGDAWGVVFRVGNWSRAYTEFDIPCPAKTGRKLYAVAPLGPDAKPRVLLDAGKGVLGSPSVGYDGKSVLVAMAAEGEDFFHIYRVPLDGGKPRRLTAGPFHDIDPAELPDGRIVFSSTRIGSFEEYHNPPSRALFVMQGDGTQIEPITSTLIFDNEPKVMADGRIAFIRTDNFFDRGKVETQIHVVRPDGTDGHTEIGTDTGADYGNRLRTQGTGSPAPLPSGHLAAITTRGNHIFAPGNTRATQPLPGNLGDLAPLPDGRLLATVLRQDGRHMISDAIAVFDPADKSLVSVYRSPEGSVHSPVFLGPRPRPPVLADTIDRAQVGRPEATGFLNCQNVQFTRKTKADWEQVRAIRVLGAVPLTVRSSHSHIVHAGHRTVELGTVPLAPDGSFSVEVPADMPLALQAVDAEGRSELNEMSWIYVRPGERRSCIGCHHPRTATPNLQSRLALAVQSPPLKLLGQGQAHQSRGNNSGVTGMMDLQFERFRESASINRYPAAGDPAAAQTDAVAAQIDALGEGDKASRIAAVVRLGVFRDRKAAAALGERLLNDGREARVAAAVALSACGTRESVPALLAALQDSDPLVAQAAAMALENLTGHAEPFQPFGPGRVAQAEAWAAWFKANSWEAIERRLIEQLSSTDRATQRRAIVALGHTGGEAARAALRGFLAAEKDKQVYPVFNGSNRTDRFTFAADSPLNPRTLQEAARATGYLQDAAAVPLLAEILAVHCEPKTGNLFLAEATIEALGRITTPEAERLLIDTFGRLPDYTKFVGWYSDHPALYACHSSPVHTKIIIALDAIGSKNAGKIAPALIDSVPTDPDRALLPENDDYETLVGRVIRRSARGEELVETCLALLGDREARPVEDLKGAVSKTYGAWAGKPAPDNRAAQILSLVCRDAKYEPRVRAVYEAYRAKPEDPVKRPLGNPSWIPQRHWVLFYLGRALGNLGSEASVDALLASLTPELNEARHGRPDPAEPNIHFLQLEYTPCWRATAAWALGRIGDRRAVPTLLSVVGNLDNAVDTRHTAAEALGRIADPASLDKIRELAADYPEFSVRRALWKAAGPTQPRPAPRRPRVAAG